MFFLKHSNGFAFSTMMFGQKNIEVQQFFRKIIVEKSRNSLNSRPALELKEFPRK